MNNFFIYIRQRYNPILYAALSAFLIVFSKNDFNYKTVDIYRFCLLLMFLLIMRLYDDLQSIPVDSNKPDRIYIQENVGRGLSNILVMLTVLFLICLALVDYRLSFYCLLFLPLNHFLYKLFFDNAHLRPYLALLKYPVIIAALSGQFTFSLLAIFTAFIAFEVSEDPQFPHAMPVKFLSSILTFSFMIPETGSNHLWLLAFLFILAESVLLINKKYSPYVFLLLFLFTKIINTI